MSEVAVDEEQPGNGHRTVVARRSRRVEVTDRDLDEINDVLDALRDDLATLAQGVEEIGDVVQALARSADRGGAGLASKAASDPSRI